MPLLIRFTLPWGWDISRLLAVSISCLFHLVAFTGLTYVHNIPLRVRAQPAEPHRSVKLLQLYFPLQPPEERNPVAVRPNKVQRETTRETPAEAGRDRAASDAGPLADKQAGKGAAPQTVKVADARADLVLDVPVPLAVTQVLRVQTEPVKVTNTPPSAPAPAEVPANPAPRPPDANVISLPDHQVVAETMVIPKVDQVAGHAAIEGTGKPVPAEALKKPVTQAARQEKPQSPTVAPEKKQATTAEKAPEAAPAQPRPEGAQAAHSPVDAAKANEAKPIPAVSPSLGPGPSSSAKDTQDKSAQPERTTRIDLPRDGVFTMSVMGESAMRQYPELASSSTAKVVSSVYLKVGLKKSWVLEFSPNEPKSGTGPLAPPWLYELYRPDELQKSPEEGAVLVAGVLNASGQFENLQLLMPKEWPQKDHVLQALVHWKFRPATRNGEAVAVKILLIIPQVPEPE
jgi:hypothetical protein